jgi:hypothetical protein
MRIEDSAFLVPLSKAVICSDHATTAGKKTIGTHDGKFHCDEVHLACPVVMLKLISKQSFELGLFWYSGSGVRNVKDASGIP